MLDDSLSDQEWAIVLAAIGVFITLFAAAICTARLFCARSSSDPHLPLATQRNDFAARNLKRRATVSEQFSVFADCRRLAMNGLHLELIFVAADCINVVIRLELRRLHTAAR